MCIRDSSITDTGNVCDQFIDGGDFSPLFAVTVVKADFNHLIKNAVHYLMTSCPVSYTHLDVYKRQLLGHLRPQAGAIHT